MTEEPTVSLRSGVSLCPDGLTASFPLSEVGFKALCTLELVVEFSFERFGLSAMSLSSACLLFDRTGFSGLLADD